MTRKQKSYKELETENTRGKKRYLERLVEDEEAAQRIEDFFTRPEQEEPNEDNLTSLRKAIEYLEKQYN